MRRAQPPQISPRGASVAARAATGLLIAVALALAVTALGSPAAGERPAGAPATSVGVAGHLGAALDAAVTTVAAGHATGTAHSPRPLSAAAAAPLASTVLVVALSIAMALSLRRVRLARVTLPPRRGPPYRLSSR